MKAQNTPFYLLSRSVVTFGTRPPSLGSWVLLGTYETSLKAKEAKTDERIRVARARASQWVNIASVQYRITQKPGKYQTFANR